MTTDNVIDRDPVDSDVVAGKITAYLEAKAKAPVAHDEDLADSGLLTSMVAMEIVVFLESTFGIAVVGGDLKMRNFRTVDDMVALVARLRGDGENAGDA
ncbi:phosphopantetheine-binding protein [Saccharothrix sp. NRRL B-16314]|uniref:phosphopantetheine-binding protein n=1 Tax=Saccharothrix sp. NRRL B-16314 TaxID=1463825 RepID=UPI0007C55C18|nr:phosphopantetheine-binding protein [Saccharothrix sp. NRRL B-16314]